MADPYYPIVVSTDGTALEGGQVFLGVAYDDPETNPVPVFWDAALTVPAAQPLRTSGGVIVRDGSPANIYAAQQTYSIRVRDRLGNIVWYKTQAGGTEPSRLSFPIATGPAGGPGDTGPADNTYTTYAALLASDPALKSARLVPEAGETEPAGNFNYINGAWVRQAADGIAYGSDTVDKALTAQSAKLSRIVNVTDPQFGAKGDGTTDDTAAINTALAGGGRIIFPGPATYKISDRLLVTVARSELVLEAGVTITGNPWRYAGSQLPFGSLILVTASDCSITGAAPGSSLIQLTGGSEANGITFLHCDGGYVGYLTVDGGKGASPAITDDTFQTGISTLNASAPNSNPSGLSTRVVVEKIEARNFAQYGMQAYGDLAATLFTDCYVHGNGTPEAGSVGCGFAITRGNRGVTITRCRIQGNKQHGILQTSAGLASNSLSFTDNDISGNGGWGISMTEQANYASVAGVGTNGVTLANNRIKNNGQGSYSSKGGVLIATYDGVGVMLNVSSTGDIIQDNGGYGLLIQTNDDPNNRTARVSVDSVVAGNMLGGIALGAKLDDTVKWNGLKIRANSVGDVVNSGDSRLISNARGIGPDVPVASTITLPLDGDAFVLTGSGTVNSIAVSGNTGRRITLIAGGAITVSNTGNITMLTNYAMSGNDTLELCCIGSTWLRTGGQKNA